MHFPSLFYCFAHMLLFFAFLLPAFVFLPAGICRLLFGAVWMDRRAEQAQG